MSNFCELTVEESINIDGGGLILAGCVIVGGCITVFGGGFAVGYGLAQWLG
jgi:hypothetical protein